jgi:integrase
VPIEHAFDAGAVDRVDVWRVVVEIGLRAVDFLAGMITLRAGETKNDEAREVPIVPQLRALLEERHAKRIRGCDHVCFRLDPTGHTVKIEGFRKAWYSACVKVGLGKMVPSIDRATGKPLYATPRGPRSKPKAKMIYEGMIFNDLRRTGVRNLVRAGVHDKVAQGISGHKNAQRFRALQHRLAERRRRSWAETRSVSLRKGRGQFGDRSAPGCRSSFRT